MTKLTVRLEDGTETVLTVDGMFIEGMHFDGLDEIEGIKETRRASDVEFNAKLQCWAAVIRPEFRRKDLPAAEHWHSWCATKRSACIEWERQYLNGEEL